MKPCFRAGIGLIVTIWAGWAVGQDRSATPQQSSTQQLRRQLLQRFDTNGDGQIDQQELTAARQAPAAAEAQGQFRRQPIEAPSAETPTQPATLSGTAQSQDQEVANLPKPDQPSAKPTSKPAVPGNGPSEAEELLAQLPAELRVEVKKEFDKDQDGQLSAEELMTARQALEQRMIQAKASWEEFERKVRAGLDRNQNGILEPKEAALLLPLMRRVLGGKNFPPAGFGSPLAALNPERIRKAVLEKFDTNGDFILSLEEQNEALQKFREASQEK